MAKRNGKDVKIAKIEKDIHYIVNGIDDIKSSVKDIGKETSKNSEFREGQKIMNKFLWALMGIVIVIVGFVLKIIAR